MKDSITKKALNNIWVLLFAFIIDSLMTFLLGPIPSLFISYSEYCIISILIIKDNDKFLKITYGKYIKQWVDEIILSIPLIIYFFVYFINIFTILIITVLMVFLLFLYVLFLSKYTVYGVNNRLPREIFNDIFNQELEKITIFLKNQNEYDQVFIYKLKDFYQTDKFVERNIYIIFQICFYFAFMTAFKLSFFSLFFAEGISNILMYRIFIVSIEYIILKGIDNTYRQNENDKNLFNDIRDIIEQQNIVKSIFYSSLILTVILLNIFFVITMGNIISLVIFFFIIRGSLIEIIYSLNSFIHIIFSCLLIYVSICLYRKIIVAKGLKEPFRNSNYFIHLSLLSLIYLGYLIFNVLSINFFIIQVLSLIAFISFLVSYLTWIINKASIDPSFNKSKLVRFYTVFMTITIILNVLIILSLRMYDFLFLLIEYFFTACFPLLGLVFFILLYVYYNQQVRPLLNLLYEKSKRFFKEKNYHYSFIFSTLAYFSLLNLDQKANNKKISKILYYLVLSSHFENKESIIRESINTLQTLGKIGEKRLKSIKKIYYMKSYF